MLYLLAFNLEGISMMSRPTKRLKYSCKKNNFCSKHGGKVSRVAMELNVHILEISAPENSFPQQHEILLPCSSWVHPKIKSQKVMLQKEHAICLHFLHLRKEKKIWPWSQFDFATWNLVSVSIMVRPTKKVSESHNPKDTRHLLFGSDAVDT